MTPQETQSCNVCGSRLIDFDIPDAPPICPKCLEQIGDSPPSLGNHSVTEKPTSPLAKETKQVNAFGVVAPNLERKKALITQSFHKDTVDVEKVNISPDLKDFYKLQNAKVRLFCAPKPIHYLLVSLFGIIICIGYLFWQRYQNKNLALAQIESLEAKLKSQADFSVAQSFAEEYFSHNNHLEALPDCLPDEELESSMRAYWQPYSLDESSLEYIGMTYLTSDYIIYRFLFTSESEPQRNVFIFRSEEDQYYFDWRSFSGIHELDVRDASSLDEEEIFTVRAKITSNSYYNFGYDESKWDSFSLSHPDFSRQSHKKINAFSSPEVSSKIISKYDKGRRTLLLKLEKKAHCVEILDLISDTPEIYHFNEYSLPLIKGLPSTAPSLSTDFPFSVYGRQ